MFETEEERRRNAKTRRPRFNHKDDRFESRLPSEHDTHQRQPVKSESHEKSRPSNVVRRPRHDQCTSPHTVLQPQYYSHANQRPDKAFICHAIKKLCIYDDSDSLAIKPRAWHQRQHRMTFCTWGTFQRLQGIASTNDKGPFSQSHGRNSTGRLF